MYIHHAICCYCFGTGRSKCTSECRAKLALAKLRASFLFSRQNIRKLCAHANTLRHFAKVSFLVRDQDRVTQGFPITLLYSITQSKSSIMLSLRAASRLSRTTCVRSFRQLRHESTNASKSSPSTSSLSQSLIGGLAGGGLVFLGGYSYYHFSGIKLFERYRLGCTHPYTKMLTHLQEQKPL